MAGMKVCPICGKDFYDGSISHTKNTCSIKCRDALYYQSPEKKFKRDVQTRLANMKSQHGIEFDSEAIERIKADLRIGKCLLCGSEENLCIDHDHVTGEYRGLLCQHCNWGIGHANESPSLLGAWIVYLMKHNARGVDWSKIGSYCMPSDFIETVYGAEWSRMKQKKRCKKCEQNQGNEYERIAACKLLTLEEKENIIRFRRIREQSADFMRKYCSEG